MIEPARPSLKKPRLRTVASVLVLLGVAVNSSLAVLGEVPELPAPLALPERERDVATMADREPQLREKAKRQFPYDLWSQDDAFHAHEQNAVRGLAARARASLGSVLLALDTHLKSHRAPLHKQTASPCKPRPFYD